MADELSTQHADTGEQIQRLKAEATALLQSSPEMRELVEAAIQTSHFHAPGMYCRVVTRRAGTVIVGKKHKQAHFYIICKGSVAVVNADGSRRILQPGDVVVSQPGTQRAVVALEDSICLTVHRTDHTDLDAIEQELIEPDSEALFDAHNRLVGADQAEALQ